MKSVFENWEWEPPAHWKRIRTIDMHTGGEPLRVVTSGLPPIEGSTMLEKRRYFREHYDHLAAAGTSAVISSPLRMPWDRS
jgi:proline racemase